MFHEFIGLAPMEGVTDFPFRLWMNLISQPAFLGTPFLRVTASFPATMPEDWAPELFLEDFSECVNYHVVPQLMSPYENYFLRTAEEILNYSDFVEVNCGCPSPAAVGKGAGSSLLKEVNHFVSFIKTCHVFLGEKKLAVKMRTGFHDTATFHELVSGIADLPLNKITIHGRTRMEKYTGHANWNLINKAGKMAKSPVFASGDITDHCILQEKLQGASAVRGAIIGRGALRNPWIFNEIREGRRQSLSFSCLREALLCYALMSELFSSRKDRLYDLCRKRVFNEKFASNTQKWMELKKILLSSLFGSANHLEVSRRSLGRLKMIWSYLRSSLPEEFFEPKILRCRNLEEFCAFLEKQNYLLKKRSGDLGIDLKWNKNYDWIYSGGKQ